MTTRVNQPAALNRFDWLGLIIAFVGSALLMAFVDNSNELDTIRPTVLVGEGCEGPSSIAVATEEDRLPRCTRIEVHEVAH